MKRVIAAIFILAGCSSGEPYLRPDSRSEMDDPTQLVMNIQSEPEQDLEPGWMDWESDAPMIWERPWGGMVTIPFAPQTIRGWMDAQEPPTEEHTKLYVEVARIRGIKNERGNNVFVTVRYRWEK